MKRLPTAAVIFLIGVLAATDCSSQMPAQAEADWSRSVPFNWGDPVLGGRTSRLLDLGEIPVGGRGGFRCRGIPAGWQLDVVIGRKGTIEAFARRLADRDAPWVNPFAAEPVLGLKGATVRLRQGNGDLLLEVTQEHRPDLPFAVRFDTPAGRKGIEAFLPGTADSWMTAANETYAIDIELSGDPLPAGERLYCGLLGRSLVPGGAPPRDEIPGVTETVELAPVTGEAAFRDRLNDWKTPAGTYALEVGPLDVRKGVRTRVRLKSLPARPLTIGLSPQNVGLRGEAVAPELPHIRALHVRLTSGSGRVLINRPFRRAKNGFHWQGRQRVGWAREVPLFGLRGDPSDEWAGIPDTAGGGAFRPLATEEYVLEMMILETDDDRRDSPPPRLFLTT